MNLIDKEDVMLLQVREQSGEIAGALDRRPRCLSEIDAEFVGDNPRECRLAEPRRPVKQDVIKGIAAGQCRLDKNREIIFDFILTDIFDEFMRAQAVLPIIGRLPFHRNDTVIVIIRIK